MEPLSEQGERCSESPLYAGLPRGAAAQGIVRLEDLPHVMPWQSEGQEESWSQDMADECGVLHISDAEIVPDTEYAVYAEFEGGETVELATVRTGLWGDGNGDGMINLVDLFGAIDAFSTASECTSYYYDSVPIVTNGTMNIFDLFAVVNAFGGGQYEGPGACGSSPSAAAAESRGILELRGADRVSATIAVVPRDTALRRGGLLEVDVYVSGVRDLRGYQVAVEATGRRGGQLEVESIMVERTRMDYIFDGYQSIEAIDLTNARVLGTLLEGGVDAERSAYLGTFILRPYRGAWGTFRVSVRPEETLLLDSAGEEIAVRSTSEATISVR